MTEHEARLRMQATEKEREMWTRIGALRTVASEMLSGARACAAEAKSIRREADAPLIDRLEKRLIEAAATIKALKAERDSAVARLTALQEALRGFVPPTKETP